MTRAERMQRLVKRKIGSQESGDYVILYLDTGKQSSRGSQSVSVVLKLNNGLNWWQLRSKEFIEKKRDTQENI